MSLVDVERVLAAFRDLSVLDQRGFAECIGAIGECSVCGEGRAAVCSHCHDEAYEEAFGEGVTEAVSRRRGRT